MMIFSNQRHIFVPLTLWLSIVSPSSYAAIDEILSDDYYQNPAELSLVNQNHWILGGQFISPEFQFKGTSSGLPGTATSHPNDFLPYLLTAYRFSEKLVMGVNLVPSGYGHFEWPYDSVVAEQSTKTLLLYYKAIIQSSYQLTKKLAMGFGINVENNHCLELDFIVPPYGNQVNRISGINVFPDFGIFYQWTSSLALTAAIYAPLNTYGSGSSHTDTAWNNQYESNIRDAAVAFVGLQQKPNDRWYFQEKIYWSGWNIQKNINFTNTTTGSYLRPADWKDVWSFQFNTRIATNEKMAILASSLYDTNPINSSTNQVGYPLAATLTLSAGLDFSVKKDLSAQIMYIYSTFTPKAQINNPTTVGTVSANIQSAILQLTYKT